MSIYLIRTVREDDLNNIVKIEKECFPEAEAATDEQFKQRIKNFGNHFFVLEYANVIIGFINGMITNETTISDEMYSDSTLHNEKGSWQTVFGLDIIKNFRRKGHASLLMKEMINKAKEENRQGVILTCKENLISFYKRFGFCEKGISKSVHGGAVWYDMILDFEKEEIN